MARSCRARSRRGPQQGRHYRDNAAWAKRSANSIRNVIFRRGQGKGASHVRRSAHRLSRPAFPISPGCHRRQRKKALAKLAAFKIGVGYPDTWIDYSTFNVVRGDAFGNMRRAEAFNRLRNLAQLKQPVDPIEWPIKSADPRRDINVQSNAEFSRLASYSLPISTYQGDAASNYGSAGAGMAHEISQQLRRTRQYL